MPGPRSATATDSQPPGARAAAIRIEPPSGEKRSAVESRFWRTCRLRPPVGRPDPRPDASLGEARGKARDGVVERLHEIVGLEPERLARQLVAGELQELVDEAPQPLPRGEDHGEGGPLARLDGTEPLPQQQVGVPEHRDERRPELVRDVGEEVVLLAIGLLERPDRRLQLTGPSVDLVLQMGPLLPKRAEEPRLVEGDGGREVTASRPMERPALRSGARTTRR
jgi:hypothetical protein